MCPIISTITQIFLSTLSLRRATNEDRYGQQFWRFLSTLSLRRATNSPALLSNNQNISIHALLAESDPRARHYPMGRNISIHALLAESDPPRGGFCYLDNIISIHALLAESDYLGAWKSCNVCDFYPRSPCGERRLLCAPPSGWRNISIHALLAESDSKSAQNSGALLRI